MTGFDGPALAPRTRGALARGERAGCILFRRNLPDAGAAARLTAEIQRATGAAAPALVGIDEEGGRVSRLPQGEPRLGPMRSLGRIGDASLVRRAGAAVGARLAELGINLDFAPVLDVDSNPANPVIGDRSFGPRPALVAELGLALAEGLRAGGVLPCGKHFPGHGDTDKDSHFDLPVLEHARARLDAVELSPFRAAAAAELEAVMSAHVVVRALDPDRPATLSRRVMTDLLRAELGFRGVLVSDDLEMRAVADRYPVEECAVLAVAAGCDLLLVCKEEEAAERAYEALVREADRSAAFSERCREAAGRVAALRSRAARLAQGARGAAAGATIAAINEEAAAALARLEDSA
jgi:beta-N-acetylhexosaminidase